MKLDDVIAQDKKAAVYNWVTDEAMRCGKYEPFDEKTYQFLIEKIISKLKYKPSFILDVGCGTGAFTRRLSGKGHKIIGVDLSDEMLDLSRKNCNGFNGISFVKADVERLPFNSGTFDAVLCFAVHHHFLSYEKVASEVSRILKPGGWLFICDPNGINPHIVLLMHPSSPMRYSFLSSNQKPVQPKTIQAQYKHHGIYLQAEFLRLKVQVCPLARRSSFWFKPLVYKYIGFIVNSIKEPWRYLPAIILFNVVHLIMIFMPKKYQANYVFLTGQKH